MKLSSFRAPVAPGQARPDVAAWKNDGDLCEIGIEGMGVPANPIRNEA